MSQITITSSILHSDTGMQTSATQSYASNEDLITAIVENVTDSPTTTVSYGDILTPKYTHLRLIAGDPVEVSFDAGATWPLRLESAEDNSLFRLNNSGSLETSTVTVGGADTDGSLSGVYFDLTDKDGAVRCYFNVPARAEVSRIIAVADTAGSLDGKGFILYDSAGSVGVWFDHGDSGTAAPADVAACTRTIEITSVSNGDSAATVATAIRTALDNDSAFSAARSTATVTVTDASVGARTNIADSVSAASGFSFSTPTNGITAVVVPATPVGGRVLAMPLTAGSTIAQVAAAITSAISADSNFSASDNGVSLVTIVDAHLGNRTDISAGTTGWTVAKVQDGAAVQSIQLRSAVVGGSSRVLSTVVPS